jgi:hypothetical protein
MDLLSHRALAAVLDTNNAWNSWFLHHIDFNSKQDFDAQNATEGQYQGSKDRIAPYYQAYTASLTASYFCCTEVLNSVYADECDNSLCDPLLQTDASPTTYSQYDHEALNPIPIDPTRMHVAPTVSPVPILFRSMERVYIGSLVELLKQQIAPVGEPQVPVLVSTASSPISCPSSVQPTVTVPPLPTMVLVDACPSSGATLVSNSSNNSNIDESKSCTWMLRYHELLDFQAEYGHVNVPYNYPENPPLAQWTKRQRHQKKLVDEGRHSNLNQRRLTLLEATGFVWDSRHAHWLDRFYELSRFHKDRGHLKISKTKKEERPLSVWLKRQRYQARLYLNGKTDGCNMTSERFSMLVAQGVQIKR